MATNEKDIEQVNLTELAGGKNGSLEIQKYLYETGLQNIFNDYNKQIASLDASKQKEVEDAYYVRELSKKYLGEYASNIGIGDVSGRLLDIYGKYQSNINEINAQFNELSSGLEASYSEKKNEYQLGLAQTQAEIVQTEKAKQQARDLAEFNYNIDTGLLPEGMEIKDYLESEREKIGEVNYWEAMTKNKLLEMSDTVKNALYNVTSYASQGEWDSYVDGLFQEKSISKQQAEYLKSIYETEQLTTFTKNNDINKTSDILFYNPDNKGIVSKGNVFESANKELVLAETSTVIDATSNLYKEIDEIGKDKSFDTPFGANGKWFVKEIKNGEQVYVEYVQSTNYNKLTNNIVIPKDSEAYQYVDKKLGGKSGGIQGTDSFRAFTYKDGEYEQYLEFQASNLKGEKGTFNINGTLWSIDKKDELNNNGKGMADLKDKLTKGTLDNDVKPIVNEMAKVYFGGDFEKFTEYVNNSRKGGVNQINETNVIVVELNRQYYTIKDGELWHLSKER